MNAIKKFGTSFSSITLHAVNVALKENTLSHTLFKSTTESRPSTLLRVFLIGRSGCPTNRKNRGAGCGSSPCKPQSLNFPLLLDITLTKKLCPHPSLNDRPHIGKKGISNSFQTNFSKIFACGQHFQLHITTYLKKLFGTKFLNTKQCPAGLDPRIIPRYHPKHLWEILGMGESPTQQPKIWSFPLPGKSSLINLHLPLSKVSFLHQIVIFI